MWYQIIKKNNSTEVDAYSGKYKSQRSVFFLNSSTHSL